MFTRNNLLFILQSLLFVHFAFALPTLNLLDSAEDDAVLGLEALISKYGYPVEVHKVHTEDNYILTLHRIPFSYRAKNRRNQVIFLQHGVLSSSADWVISGVDRALAYILADQGYDVWMGNARGNKFSREHAIYDPNNSNQFWDFSWHEIGYYDLPAMIDFILDKTKEQKLYYVGHSQGTTSFFVMCSERPEYNEKIEAHFSLAPIGYMNHMTSPLMHLMAWWDKPIEMLLDLVGIREFLPNSKFMTYMGEKVCSDHSRMQVLCENSLFAICGFSYKEMNESLLPILMGHTPAGSSTKQFLHYAQEIKSGHFRKYDHGMFGNLHKYGRIYPPRYDLRKVTADVYLIWSENDWLSAAQDVYKLCRELKNCQGKFMVGDGYFNHLDYMYGINAPKLVYNKILSLINRISGLRNSTA